MSSIARYMKEETSSLGIIRLEGPMLRVQFVPLPVGMIHVFLIITFVYCMLFTLAAILTSCLNLVSAHCRYAAIGCRERGLR